jgi:Cu(I)/Ag(I) efflux system membrane fusion protein
MFAQVDLPVTTGGKVLTVPLSAVLDSGTRQVVLVQLNEGRFQPRDVRLGVRSDELVEVISGLKAGEAVVTAANFLIDAESNLKAALGGFAPAAQDAAPASSAAPAFSAPLRGSEPTVAASTPQAGATPVRSSAGAGYRTEGTIESIDAADGSLMLNHEAVPGLKWPAMTMEFKVANASLLANLKPGLRVAVQFVQRQPDEWVITRIDTVRPASAAKAPAADPHAAHAGH